MKYVIEARNIWELGQRTNQEDAMFPKFNEITESDRLFIVCDGMGGHDAGEIASQTVCQAFADAILKDCPETEGKFSEDNFKKALAEAYDALDGKDTGAEKKMGTTMTFLKLHEEGYTIAHIGDSRVYHVRPGKDAEGTEIVYQTTDHSLVNDLIKIGEITPEEAKFSKQKNVITRAMQPNMERRSRADIYPSADIKKGDYFMLCTDGVLEQMEDENIKFIFSEKVDDIDKKTKMLIDVTADNRDNHSAILVHILDVQEEEKEVGPEIQNSDLNDNRCAEKDLIINKAIKRTKRQKGIYDKETKSSKSRLIKKRSVYFLMALLIVGVATYVCSRLGLLDWVRSYMAPIVKNNHLLSGWHKAW